MTRSALIMPKTLASLALMAGLLATPSAQAKDLGSRVGVGFDTSLASIPTLSVRYGVPTGNRVVNLQIEADIGADLAKGSSAMVLGGRALYAIAVEDNVNFYAVGGLAMTTGDTGSTSLQPGFAMDMFLFGLENIGFTTAWGLDIVPGEDGGLATTGDLAAGVHYWF